MLHYNVWFSYKAEINENIELEKVRVFLDDLKSKGAIANYSLLKTRAKDEKGRLSKYHAPIEFADNNQFDKAISSVSKIGIHSGLHGIMIGQIKDFIVEVFDVI
jgi:hypothetical protein